MPCPSATRRVPAPNYGPNGGGVAGCAGRFDCRSALRDYTWQRPQPTDRASSPAWSARPSCGPGGRPNNRYNDQVMELTTGSRWKSAVCATEVIIVRAVDSSHTLECGGAKMVPIGARAAGGTPNPALSAGTLLGKRYSNDESGLEVLCTKAGIGTLALDGVVLEVKTPKPLPSSD